MDDIYAADDHVAIRNGYILHLGRLYSHFVGHGRRRGVDSCHAGTRPCIALQQQGTMICVAVRRL